MYIISCFIEKRLYFKNFAIYLLQFIVFILIPLISGCGGARTIAYKTAEKEKLVEILPGGEVLSEKRLNERVISSSMAKIQDFQFDLKPGHALVHLVKQQRTIFDLERLYEGEQIIRVADTSHFKAEVGETLSEGLLTVLLLGIPIIAEGNITNKAMEYYKQEESKALSSVRNGSSTETVSPYPRSGLYGFPKIIYKRVRRKYTKVEKDVQGEKTIPVPSENIYLDLHKPGLPIMSAITNDEGVAEIYFAKTFDEILSLSPMSFTIYCGSKSKPKSSIRGELTAKTIESWVNEHEILKDIGLPKLPPFAKLIIDVPVNAIEAGNKTQLSVTVTNIGKGEYYRLMATTESDLDVLNGIEFPFGMIVQGESRTVTKNIEIPLTTLTQQTTVSFKWKEYNDFAPDEISRVISIKGKNRPIFAYSYKVVDDMSGNSVGNGDGRIQKGEAVDIIFTIANVGDGKTGKASIVIDSPLSENVVINYGRKELEVIHPGERKTARLTATIKKSFNGEILPVNLKINESDYGVSLIEQINFPLDKSIYSKVIGIHKNLIVNERIVNIHGGAGKETLVIAQVEKGNGLVATGQLDDWYRVLIGENETGWIYTKNVNPVVEKNTEQVIESKPPTIIKIMQKAPPVVALASPSDGQSVSVENITLKGTIADDSGVDRLEIKVNGKLIDNLAKRGVLIESKKEISETNLDFNREIKLAEGKNNITLTAYDIDGLYSVKTINVMRVIEKGDIFAAVIGISNYEKVRSLKYADDDAEAFYNYLIKSLGVPEKNVYKAIDKEATLKTMRDILGITLKKMAGKEDTVIVYFAGHGSTEPDPNILDGDGLEKYLLPYNADIEALYSTAMPMDEIKKIFQRIQAERIIFIVDSCYSGASGGRAIIAANRMGQRGEATDSYLDRLSKGRGRIIITASRANELSVENDDLKHGVFTYYLLEALNGKGDMNGDHVISLSEAYRYVSKMVPDATSQNQHPIIRLGEIEGEIILGGFK